MDITYIDPLLSNNTLAVIVETPMGSRFKYAFNEQYKTMEVRHELPKGYTFPVNFGFVPNTIAGDGDPLDVLVLSDTPLATASLVICRCVGALLARQRKGHGSWMRNDRLVAVPIVSRCYDDTHTLRDLDKIWLQQVEQFFVDYNAQRNITFESLRKATPVQALNLIRKGASSAGRQGK